MGWHKDLTDRECLIAKMVIDGWYYHGVARHLETSIGEVERALARYRELTPRDEMRHL